MPCLTKRHIHCTWVEYCIMKHVRILCSCWDSSEAARAIEKAHIQELYMSLLLVALPSFVSSVHFRIDCVCAMCSSLVSYGVKGGNSTSLGRSLTSNTCDRGGDFWAYHVIDYVVQKSNTFQLQRPFFSFNMSKADQEEGSRFWDWKLLLYSTSQLQCFQNPFPNPFLDMVRHAHSVTQDTCFALLVGERTFLHFTCPDWHFRGV